MTYFIQGLLFGLGFGITFCLTFGAWMMFGSKTQREQQALREDRLLELRQKQVEALQDLVNCIN